MTDLTPPITTGGQKPYSTGTPLAELRVLDIACFRDKDAHTPGVYLAYSEISANAPSAGRGLWMAHDAQDGWIYLGPAQRPSPLGHAHTVLGAPGGNFGDTDETNTVDVKFLGLEEPQPITDSALNYERDNLALLGHEVISYRDVTILGPSTYRLGGLRRGLLGTDDGWGHHYVGEPFTGILQSIHFIPIDMAMRGKNLRFRIGPTSTKSFSERQQVFQGWNSRPHRPTKLATAEASGVVTTTWERSSRISYPQSSDKPLPEVTESYEVVIEPTIDPASPQLNRAFLEDKESHVYSVQEQTDDGTAAASFMIFVHQRDQQYGTGRPAMIHHVRGG
jgi:hypothetical protein